MSINLRIKESEAIFSFISDVSSLHTTLAKVVSVTNYSSSSESSDKQHVLASNGIELFIVGYTQETFCVCRVPGAEVSSGSGHFAFSPDILKGITKNRKKMSFSYNKSSLVCDQLSGNYKCQFSVSSIAKDQIPMVNNLLNGTQSKARKLSSDVIASISEGVKLTSLNSVYLPDLRMLSFVNVSKERVNVSSFDDFHLSLYSRKLESKYTCKISMPSLAFTIIDKFIETEGYASFYVLDSGLRVEYDSFIVMLPPVQTDSSSFNSVSDLVSSLRKGSDATFYTGTDLLTTLSNSSVLFTHGVSNPASMSQAIKFEVSDTYLNIISETPNGSADNRIPIEDCKMSIKNNSSYMVEPILLMDLVKNVRPDSKLKVALFKDNPNISTSCIKIDYMVDPNCRISLISTLKDE